jgi:Ca2+-dependent lipid-binding protein
MYVRKQHRKAWFEYGRTEVVPNTFSPEWNTKFTIAYNFEERQVIKY